MRSLGPPYNVGIDPIRFPEAWLLSLRMQVLTHTHTNTNTLAHTHTHTHCESVVFTIVL